MSRRKKIMLASIAIFIFLLITYATMVYNDFNRVFNQHQLPAFAINFDPVYRSYFDDRNHWEDSEEACGISRYVINYGVFRGLGYTIELSASFRPFRAIPAVVNDRAVVINYYDAIADPETGEIANPVPGVLQARMTFFGREIAVLNRPYPEDFWIPPGFELFDIFDPNFVPPDFIIPGFVPIEQV